ncbi:MAG: lysophospholipid acyltransferase family protein [Burkholderiales bacterium]
MTPFTLKIPPHRFFAPLRWYHRLLWRIASVLRLAYPLRVEGAERLPRTGGAVVIAPHMSFSDSFLFLYPALPRPARFLSSVFFMQSSAPVSWLMYLGGVLPLSKCVPDTRAARRMLRLLAGGEVVALFPEGERSWTGVSTDPVAASAKFLSRLKVPVYIAEIEGAYDHWPRWGQAPRWRPVTVRLQGPIALTGPVAARERRLPQRKWWDPVYHSGGHLDAAAARTALATLLRELSRDEAARLDLLDAGRFRQVPRLICYCPECARPQLLVDGRRLACPDCGASWHAVHGGALRREGDGDRQKSWLLSDLFARMLETLHRNIPSLLPLEVPVSVTVTNGARGAAAAGRVRLDRNGVLVTAAGIEWEIDLAAVALGDVEGATTLEVHARCGAMLALESNPSALHLVLPARALLDLPWGGSAAQLAPRGAGEPGA